MKRFEQETMRIQNPRAPGMDIPASTVRELESLRERVHAHPAIHDLLSRQKEYEELLRKVNDEINRAIHAHGKGGPTDPGSGPEGE